VDRNGAVYLDKKPMAPHELVAALAEAVRLNPNVRVFISGDEESRHGRMMEVLDAVRSAGVDKVAFEVQTPGAATKGGAGK
jgi:biopolymer transport protein ExbD